MSGSRTSTGSGTTKFVYDDTDVVRDLDANGNTIADYLNGPGIDNKLQQTSGGGASYFVTDHLGTTLVFSDASGNATSSVNYDSFGNVTAGSAATRYTYTGREFDADTGLMYYRARWYDPDAGRFLSEHPIGFGGGDINLYVYVHNSPINLIDPFGEQVRADARWRPGEIEDSRRLRTRFVECHDRVRLAALVPLGGLLVPLGIFGVTTTICAMRIR